MGEGLVKLGNHGKPFSRLIALTVTLLQGGRELVTTICKSPFTSLGSVRIYHPFSAIDVFSSPQTIAVPGPR